MLAILASLLLTACDLQALDGDSGAVPHACPTGVALTEADLPCACRQDLVTELLADVCVCDSTTGLSCADVFDTGTYGPASPP